MLQTDAIESLRKKTLQLIDENNDQIDPRDVDLITGTNDFLWRFLLNDLDLNDKVTDKHDLSQVNMDNASKLLLETLKWRKQYGLHTLTNANIPVEFYRMKMFTYSHLTDIEPPRIFLFIRVCKYINISSSFREFIIKAIFFEIDKRIHSLAPRYQHGLCDLQPIVVLDCTGMSLQAVDIQLLVTILTLVAHHYPMLIHEIWLHRVPWFAKYAIPILMKALPRSIAQRMVQTSHEEAVAKVGAHLLPKFMGGTCPVQPDIEVPSDAGGLDQLIKKFGLKQSEVDKFKKHLATLKDD